MSKPEEFKFDSRVRDRLRRNRVLSTADLQQHLAALPDLEGEYEVLNDTPQPAVTPPRSEVSEEPLVFDGIRRLQALTEASHAAPAPRYVPPVPSSSGLPSYREPESRPLGTPLRSALMESEISGVGAGAVSAALGAMAAEARGASVFGVPSSIPHMPAQEPVPPVTLRSEPNAQVPAAPAVIQAGAEAEAEAEADEDEDEEDEDEDDLDDDDDDDVAVGEDTDEEDEEDEDDGEEEEEGEKNGLDATEPDDEGVA